MNKLNEMWTALAAYQPQADKAGHGDTWATMCREKTSGAAADAEATAYAAYKAADAAETAYAAWSAYAYAKAALAAARAAAVAAVAAYAAGEADEWAQKVIDGINKLKE